MCTADRIYTETNQILQLKENDRIYLDDGKIELAVERVGKYHENKSSIHFRTGAQITEN